jgi:2-polyprenyl-3-methyl-5-hydroxy-6-metoxy-1,4-benzoquinol methylase
MENQEKDNNSEKHKEWENTQLQWDDTDFLNNTATKLMKLKWKRLNLKIAEIIEKEVVEKNEYISLLDIGAGRGEYYKQVQPMLKKYTGIEPSFQMLKDELGAENFELKRGCGEEMTFDSEYDACLLKEVLDHTFDPEKVIKNSSNALKPGGLLIVSLTNKNAFYKLIFKGYAKKLEKEHTDHLYNFNPEEVKVLMEKAGLEVENVYSINYLKLPAILENVIGSFPEKLVFFKLDLMDNLLSSAMPGKGGGFIITGRKDSPRSTEE